MNRIGRFRSRRQTRKHFGAAYVEDVPDITAEIHGGCNQIAQTYRRIVCAIVRSVELYLGTHKVEKDSIVDANSRVPVEAF